MTHPGGLKRTQNNISAFRMGLSNIRPRDGGAKTFWTFNFFLILLLVLLLKPPLLYFIVHQKSLPVYFVFSHSTIEMSLKKCVHSKVIGQSGQWAPKNLFCNSTHMFLAIESQISFIKQRNIFSSCNTSKTCCWNYIYFSYIEKIKI